MAALIDTSFLLALLFSKDSKHELAEKAIDSLARQNNRVVPEPVLHELFYMTLTRLNYRRAVGAIEYIQNSAFDIQPIILDDRKRMIEIMNQYASAELDYTDTAIMALSERLNITQVYTFDRRDFSIFRPRHCDYLELMPA